jgi:hypothetical protein
MVCSEAISLNRHSSVQFSSVQLLEYSGVERAGWCVWGLLQFSPCESLLLEASKTLNKGNVCRWEPFPGNDSWRHSRLRGLSTRCIELQSLWIINRAIVIYSYDLKVVNKSNYHSKPRLQSPIHVTICRFILTNQPEFSNGSTEEGLGETTNAYRFMVRKYDENILYGDQALGKGCGSFYGTCSANIV